MGEKAVNVPQMPPNPTPEQVLLGLLQMSQLLMDAFLKLDARFDALKTTVCELHPEISQRLEQHIQEFQTENSRKFSELLIIQEFLRRAASGPVQ
jgi:hypothetical protein